MTTVNRSKVIDHVKAKSYTAPLSRWGLGLQNAICNAQRLSKIDYEGGEILKGIIYRPIRRTTNNKGGATINLLQEAKQFIISSKVVGKETDYMYEDNYNWIQHSDELTNFIPRLWIHIQELMTTYPIPT